MNSLLQPLLPVSNCAHVIMLFGLVIPIAGFGQSEVPPDSVKVWLTRYCNQEYQSTALIAMSEPVAMPGPEWLKWLNWRVKDEYNSTEIRDAFRLFVRSITMVDCTASCDTVIYDWSISANVNSPQGETKRNQILSIYIWWGFTEDLYRIADTLYIGYTNYSLSWNKLGPGYFKHVYDSVKADTNFYKGIDIAAGYLAGCPQPLDTMNHWALETMKYASLSSALTLRSRATYTILNAYMNGHSELKSSVDTLLNSGSAYYRQWLSQEIRRYQQTGLLKEFK